MTGREIGPSRIPDNYSVVGVPEAAVGSVVAAVEAEGVGGKEARAGRFVS